MKAIILAALLLLATKAQATPNILFQESPVGVPFTHTDWVGSTFPFSILIGNCRLPIQGTYDEPESLNSLFSNSNLDFFIDSSGKFGELRYIPLFREWTTDNPRDSQEFRHGIYCGMGPDPGCVFRDVPELSNEP